MCKSLTIYWRCGHFMRSSMVQCLVAKGTPVVQEDEIVLCNQANTITESKTLERLCDFCWKDDKSRNRLLAFWRWEAKNRDWERKREEEQQNWEQRKSSEWFEDWNHMESRWYIENAKWENNKRIQKQRRNQKIAAQREQLEQGEVIDPSTTLEERVHLVNTYPYRYTNKL